jgi:hypothetical protein
MALGHDPEKWVPVFGKDHAQRIAESGMTLEVIPLEEVLNSLRAQT